MSNVVYLRAAQPSVDVDPVKAMWDRGLAVLGGVTPATRKFLGGCRKKYGDDVVMAAIVACEDECPSDPLPFFVKCLQQRAAGHPGSGKGAVPGDKFSPRSVISEMFRGSSLRGTFTQQFLREAFQPARELRLGCTDQVLAQRLVELHAWVDRERRANRARADGPPENSPDGLVRRYVEWLGDRGWEQATVRVLSHEAAAFDSFRRDLRSLDPFDRDPVTWCGRE